MRAATTRSQMHSYAKNKGDSKSNISDKLHKLGCLFLWKPGEETGGDLDHGVMSGSLL